MKYYKFNDNMRYVKLNFNIGFAVFFQKKGGTAALVKKGFERIKTKN